MDQQQKKELRNTIQAAIAETEEAIVHLEERTKPVTPDNAIGRLSRMDAISNKSISQSSLNSSRQKLKMLNSALDRIDDPEFGICADCGEHIPLGRIMIMPESRLCVHCAA